MVHLADDRIFIQSIVPTERQLEIRWKDGHTSRFHYVWLRDNCDCAVCGDKSGGHRYLELLDLPLDVTPQAVCMEGDGHLASTWQADGHKTRYAAVWLRAHCYSERARAERRPRSVHWDASTFDALPDYEYPAVCANPEHRLRMLRSLRDYGFTILRGVPTEQSEIERVAGLFGFIRRTHYGRIFDLRSTPEQRILAQTSHAIRPHNDELFRDPAPGVLIMHCLAPSSDGGGASVLVDGFQVANRLRAIDPDAFSVLTRVPILHRRYLVDAVDDVALRAKWHTIELDDDGEVTAVRINERTMAPLDIPHDSVETVYRALQRLLELVYRADASIQFRLDAGDAVVFDNHRVLHARTGFNGERHIRQCHVDRDEVFSRLRALEHRLHGSSDGWSWSHPL